MKKGILFVIFGLIIFPSIVFADVYSKDDVENSTYIIGTFLFNRNTNDIYSGSLTTPAIMLASRSIGNGEENVIYYKNARGIWINAINNDVIENIPENFDISCINLDCDISDLNIPSFYREYDSDTVGTSTYVIGTHILDRNSNQSYNGTLTTQHIMEASKTIYSNNLDDMVVYYKNTRGIWINAITNEVVDAPDIFKITHIDLEKISYTEKNINDLNITLGNESYTYDGNNKKPTVIVKDGSIELVKNVDYTIEYLNNVDAGTATVVITACGIYNNDTGAKYVGSVSKSFIISKATINYEVNDYSGDYDGLVHSISLSVVEPISGVTIKYGTEEGKYDLTTNPSYSQAGTYKVYYQISADNYETVTGNSTVTINKVKTAALGNCNNLTYTGLSQVLASGGSNVDYVDNNGVNVDSYTVTVNAESNYLFSDGTSSKTLTCSIGKKELTVTADDKSMNYGDNAPSYSYQVIGFVNNESNSVISGEASYTIKDSNNQTINNVKTANAGSYKISVSGLSADNYSFRYVDGILTIGKVLPTITMSDKELTYTGSEVVNSATSNSNGQMTYTYYNGGTCEGTVLDGAPVNYRDGGYSVKASQAQNGNYLAGSKCAKITINKKDLTITAKEQSISYGSSIAIGINQVTVSGLVTGHTLNAITLSSSTTDATTSGKITPSAAMIKSGEIDVTNNYNVDYVEGTLTINPLILTVPSSPSVKTYNGSSQESGITCPSGSTTGGDTSGTNAGNYSQTCTLSSTTNYKWDDDTTTAKSINWKIGPKSVAVTWGDTTTFTYNGSGQAPSVSVILGVNNETINVGRTTGTNAGSYTSTASCLSVTNGSCDNYTLTNTTKNFTINPQTLTVPSSPSVKTYNGSSQESGITCPTGSTALGDTSGMNAGDYSQTCTLNSTTNYKWDDDTTTAKSINWIINKSLTATTGSCNSLTYNGSDQTLASGGNNVSYSNNSGTNAGNYTVTVNANSNYAFSDGTTSKTLTCSIGTKSITVTATNQSKTWDGNALTADSSCSVTSGSLVSGHSLSCSSTGSQTGAGSSMKTLSTAKVMSGSTDVSSNYTITKSNGTLTVNKSATATTGSCNSLTYNGSGQTLASGGSYITYTNNSGTNASSYTVNVASDSNHTFSDGETSKSLTCSIPPKTLTIPSSPSARTYNGSSQESGITCPTGSTAGGTTSATNAGNYSQTCTLSSTTNYKWNDDTTTSKSISCKINPKNISVSWQSADIYTYNSSLQGPVASASSGVEGEILNITNTKNVRAGNYTSVASIDSVSGGKVENYILTNTSKDYVIKKATPDITLSATSGSIYEGEKLTFTVKSNILGSFKYQSNSNNIATLMSLEDSNVSANSEKGVTINGISEGVSVISIQFIPDDTTNYENINSEYAVTVKKVIPITKIELDEADITLGMNSCLQLMATITPLDATYKDLIWSSSDESVATVSNTGEVNVVGPGNVVITVKDSRSSVSTSIDITVHFDLDSIDRAVGINYSLWFNNTTLLNQIVSNSFYNITEIQAGNGDYGPVGTYHYWGKPQLGYYNYYNYRDVIKTHMRQLVEAGVDFIIIDHTNVRPDWGDKTDTGGGWYDFVYKPESDLLKYILEMRNAGEKTPYVVNWVYETDIIPTSDNSIKRAQESVLSHIYDEFYTNSQYEDLWVYYDGLPFIIGTQSMTSADDYSYNGVKMGNLISYRKMWGKKDYSGGIDPYQRGEWSFLEDNNSNLNNGVEQLSVSPAIQHPYMSDSTTAIGRRDGCTWYEQWYTAFAFRPKVITITEWNEWIAQKQSDDIKYAFVDNFNAEYSRDIEPQDGILGDSYYQWMKKYIYAYKNNLSLPNISEVTNVDKYSSCSVRPDNFNLNSNWGVTLN